MRILCWAFILALCSNTAIGAESATQTKPMEFRDGDRVALVGDTLIERAQTYGFLETELLAAYPDRRFQFRNLGWSGDTVRGLSRAYFDPPEKGTERLYEHVAAVKPTVLIVGYGMAESFAGPDGIKPFQQGLGILLDKVASDVDHVVLLSPIAHAQLPKPFPDVTEHNRNLAMYTKALQRVADKRDSRFIDAFAYFSKRPPIPRLTDNGIHLNEFGYWYWSLYAAGELGINSKSSKVVLTADGRVRSATGASVLQLQASDQRISFEQTSSRLPTPQIRSPDDSILNHPCATTMTLQVSGLAEGTYALTIDALRVATASAAEWAAGVELAGTPQHRQADRLRELVIRKNRLVFHRYRPQNITYLLGFRRHEQGQNAKEIERLDEFIRETEDRIDALRVPQKHRFLLTRVVE